MNRLVQLTSRMLEIRSTWLVAIITFLWVSATTWTRPLMLPDEGRYVGVAWGMLDVGQAWVPRLDGLPFFHKPPLFYWVTELSLWLFGVNEWAARLCSVLAATLMAAMFFWLIKTFADRRVAILATLVLVTAPFFVGGGQYANMDMTVAAAITATVVLGAAAVFRMERGERYRLVLTLAYAAAGFGFLAKGLIGIALPGGIIVFWLAGRRRFDLMRRMFIWPGFVALAVVALPWMVYMEWHFPGFFHYYIIYQQFDRFLETSFNNRQPFWFYVPVLLVMTLPWSTQVWRLARGAYWKNAELGAFRGLMVSWFLVVLIFFSIPASKLIGYILPLLPPFAFFLAELFAQRLGGDSSQRALKVLSRYWVVSACLCLIAVIVLVVSPRRTTKYLAEQVRTQYQPADKVVMLDYYYYDFNFYLRTAKSAMIVSRWKDPEILLHDGWRKELYDAGQFDPAAADKLLITSQTFREKLCGPRAVNLWLVGDTDSLGDFPFLKTLPVRFKSKKLRAWFVPAGEPLKFCSGTPKTAPK
ncbi:MAG TPA: glycosyltransferase family 39 protein [Burkholderiaceae bacterium]|nr:glycosyltransferase family 39 protein [Burkholderiaceae bacterium]